jgi:hypothetical protein
MFDIKAVEDEARAELAVERVKAAKTKIKASLQGIARAEAILTNLREEHNLILREAGSTVG